jgi:hypothetical protein
MPKKSVTRLADRRTRFVPKSRKEENKNTCKSNTNIARIIFDMFSRPGLVLKSTKIVASRRNKVF